jgi:cytochrome oxidase assembly protein ShyY1
VRIIPLLKTISGAEALRTWLAIAFGLAVAALAMSLGNWQTRRGDMTEAIEARWDAAAAARPTTLASGSEAAAVAAALPRRVAAHGSFAPEATVFVDNRALEGVAGFYVVTPLRLADGSVVLVNRGWLPRDPRDPARIPPLATPSGPAAIEGLAVSRVPRLLELASAQRATLPGIWPNMDYDEYERASGLRVARFVVQQTSDTGDGLRRVWPRPAAGVEKHRGYALQWYGLALLSAGLTVYFGGRALRRRDR